MPNSKISTLLLEGKDAAFLYLFFFYVSIFMMHRKSVLCIWGLNYSIMFSDLFIW